MKVVAPPPPPGDRGALPSTRRGSVITAIVVGVLAAIILVVFLSGYRSSVGNGSKTETVLAARNLLPKGSSGDSIAANGLFQAIRVKTSQAKAGALTDPGALRGKVTNRQIFAGEQLSENDFRTKDQNGVIDELGGSQRAIAVPVDDTHGLLGDLSAGDHVDVYGAYDVQPNGGSGNGNGNGHQFARELLKNVTVLKTSAKAGGGGGVNGGGGQANVVLSVPETNVGQVALTAEYGKTWLVLRPGAGAQSTPTPTTDSIETILLGVNPHKVTQAFDQIGTTTNQSGLSAIVRLLIGVRAGQ